MKRLPNWLALGLCFGVLLNVTCGPPLPPPGADCRYNPNCNAAGGLGGVGAYCDHDNQCVSGHCCEKDECDGGMCTQGCNKDKDCPADMLCEHNECFWVCDHDSDCADGQNCVHGNRVCEW